MPEQGEPSIHLSLLLIAPDGTPGPTMGNYDTLQEAVDNWVENYTEDGPDIAIVRVFSEVTHMEVVSEEEIESVQENDMSNTSFDDLVMQLNEPADLAVDEHPDWAIKEFHAIVNYIAALDQPGLEVPPVSTHDSLSEAKEEFTKKVKKIENQYKHSINDRYGGKTKKRRKYKTIKRK